MSSTFPVQRALVLSLLLGANTADAGQRVAIINVAGCASITWPNQGYALLDQFFEMSNGVENDVEATAVLLCDADLPPGAPAFDYRLGGTDNSPWISVLYVWREVTPNGGVESWEQEVGMCGQGPPMGSFLGPEIPMAWGGASPPLSICQTQGNLDLGALATAAPGAEGSLVFLVIVPGGMPGDYGTGWSQAFRIVEYFEQ